MIIPCKNIDNVNNFEFYYLSNPINEKSNLVTRNSDTDSISKVIEDILLNNRFDRDYLKN
jgi:hypothetical protein